MSSAWQLLTPTLGGPIDPTFFKRYDTTVKAALAASTRPYVILDLVDTPIALSELAS